MWFEKRTYYRTAFGARPITWNQKIIVLGHNGERFTLCRRVLDDSVLTEETDALRISSVVPYYDNTLNGSLKDVFGERTTMKTAHYLAGHGTYWNIALASIVTRYNLFIR